MTAPISRSTGSATSTPTRPGGGVRPMYGVVIRDRLAELRGGIQRTINDLQVSIAMGKPHAREIATCTRGPRSASLPGRALGAAAP